MAKALESGENDGEGPSSPLKKKPRTSVKKEVVEDEDGNEEEQEVKIKQEEESDQEDEEEEEEEEEVEESEQDEEGSEQEGDEEEEQTTNVESNKDGSISVTLTDPKVLHCSICLQLFTIPVFQCKKGHAACSSCCNNLDNKCLFCYCPIGYIRCLAIEKVLESVKVWCQNCKYGCNETVSFIKKHEHEKSCIYAPCSCPIPDCNFISSFKRLSWHLRGKHSHSATRFQYNSSFSVSLKLNDNFLVLQEEKNGILFILNNYSELHGNIVTVNCIGPCSSEGRFLYDLRAKTEAFSLKLTSVMDSIQTQVDNPPSAGFLLVPYGFFGSCALLKLDLRIRPADS